MSYQTTEAQEALREKVRAFAETEIKPLAFLLDKENQFPREAVAKLGQLGLMGIPFEKKYGGAGLDVLSYAIAVEELARLDGGAGVILSAHTSLGTWPIAAFGTEEQKKKYLLPLCKGTAIGAFGLTEPNAGSDAGGTETTAELDGEHYLLNGGKIFITNGGEADTYVVFAVTTPDIGVRGISAFIVEKGWEGFAFGDHYDKMGIRSSATCELIFNNVRVPKENLLGKEGEGFKIAMATMDGGRIGMELQPKPLFNPGGDTEVRDRRLIGGNTTNLNDFNNLRYPWVSDWYRQAMNNFWIPEEINLHQDVKDYPHLLPAERAAYDKILSFLIFLDSIQTANLPSIGAYVTANEVNLCLTIQSFQECVHSQSYSYMLDTICSPTERSAILYQWKDDAHLLKRNTFIGELYNEFQSSRDARTFLRVLVANYILEGIYFYSGFMFFYNLGRNGKMPGSVQEIRYINRDENTHLWLFRNVLQELRLERPELFSQENVEMIRGMMDEGVRQEIAWGHYVIGDAVPGLTREMVTDYIRYLGNLRFSALGLGQLYEGCEQEPESMAWVSQYSNANLVKTDFFEARSTAYAKSTALVDDL